MVGPSARGALSLALALTVNGSAWSAEAGFFSKSDFELQDVGPHTVLVGFLRGGPVADLAAWHVDEHGDRRIQLFGFDGSVWSPQANLSLGADIQFVDVARIEGRDRLIAYTGGRLVQLNPESGARQTVANVMSSFTGPRPDEVPHVDVSHDLNGDGLDDLAVPDWDGFWVLVQESGGRFSEPVKIGTATDLAGIYGADGYRYDPWSHSRIHEADFNLDGRIDLAFWDGERFEVHLQVPGGRFARVPQPFATAAPFDSDDRYTLAVGAMTGRVLHSLRDMNGDGIADLTVLSLSGRRVAKKHSAYEVYFGRASAAGLVFPTEPDTALRADSKIQLGLRQAGAGSILVTSIDIEYLTGNPWKRLKGYMGDDIWLDLDLHAVAGGTISTQSAATRRIQLHNTRSIREPGSVPLRFVLRGGTHADNKAETETGCIGRDERCAPHGDSFNAPLLLGDVTGDGHVDLLIGTTPWSLDLSAGVAGSAVLADGGHSIGVDLPDDGEFVWLANLNGDAAMDVVVHHPQAQVPDRIIILVAR